MSPKPSMGILTVITGPMFAGKTKSLIECVKGLPPRVKVMTFKPTTDTRYDSADIISHNGDRVPAQWVDPDLRGVDLCEFIIIDEAQFLTLEATFRIRTLLLQGADITLAGLDLTYTEEPFGQMPTLLALASVVTKLTGTCAQCGARSTRTFRKGSQKEVVLVGGTQTYESRCYACYHGINQVGSKPLVV